ncbi:MAG: phosphatase PAP2 family protein [Chromatiaceae bacterium]|nr:MAG: phosphatase PAP2 family protein [Chromatiaceae bacterium]
MPTLSKRILACLRQDLRAALAAGVARDPADPPGAARWLWWAVLGCALTGLTLFQAAGYTAGFAWLNAYGALVPAPLWQWLTVLGDERVAFCLALLLARRHPRLFWTLILAALVAIAYGRGLKALLAMPRPPALLTPDSFNLIGIPLRRLSFPSGHSVTAGVFFGVLAYYARGPGWRGLWLLLALLVGLSRVAVGVHWPVDVAAGLGGGLLAVLAGAWLARRFPVGMQDGSVHLALVSAAAIVSIGLFYDHGGYPGAARPLQALAAVALGRAVLDYVLLPLGHAMQAPADRC